MNNLHKVEGLIRLSDDMKVAIVRQINAGRRVRLHRTKVRRELRAQYYQSGYWGGGRWYDLAPMPRHHLTPGTYDNTLAQFPAIENQIGRSRDF